jgi:hypothetical protein
MEMVVAVSTAPAPLQQTATLAVEAQRVLAVLGVMPVPAEVVAAMVAVAPAIVPDTSVLAAVVVVDILAVVVVVNTSVEGVAVLTS